MKVCPYYYILLITDRHGSSNDPMCVDCVAELHRYYLLQYGKADISSAFAYEMHPEWIWELRKSD